MGRGSAWRRARIGVAGVAVLLAVSGCGGGKWIDEECIKGRLSQQQADAVNRGPWGHLPGYNRGSDGECVACAEAEDRILSARCSDFLKEHDL